MTVGSVFAGIGGFDLGFERAGYDIRWQVEIDPWARAVLAKHWPHVHRHDDICTAGAHNLEAVDVLCGGFPCQDISLAGKGAGIADGTRSGLWAEYARLIRELRPRYVVVENVAALLARGLGRVLGDLAACGYDAEWDCIPAAAVGAPHRRDRLWLVAYPQREPVGHEPIAEVLARRCGPLSSRWPEELANTGSIGRWSWGSSLAIEEGRRAFAGHPSDANVADADGGRLQQRDSGERRVSVADAQRPTVANAERSRQRPRLRSSQGREPHTERGGEVVADTDGRGRHGGGQSEPGGLEGARRRVFDGRRASREQLNAAGREQWAAEPDVGRVAHGVPARVDRLRGLGNAIVPQIAEWIARRILEAEARRVAA
jgi:DNA (cytosine-5)-methyltransferase 1